MPSTYTTSLRLTLPATGELAGTWGTTVNAGVTSLAEAAIAGTAAVTMIDADYTLTAVNGSADQARNMFVTLTGTLSTARNVICPPVSKLYFVTNNTTGGYAITFKTLAGTGISVPNGQRAVVYCNGTDVLGGLTALDSLSLNGSLTLVGGTANTVPYLNGSKVVTTGAALAFDGANLSLGAAPSAWSASYKAYELPAGAVWSVSPASLFLTSNAYNNGTNYIYKTSNAASQYQQGAGAHTWSVAASGTAGATFSFTQAMTLDSSGNLGVGTVSPVGKLSVTNPGTGAVGFNAGTISSPNRGNLFYDTDGSGWDFRIGKLQSGVFTPQVTLNDSGNLGIGTASTGNYRLRVDATNRSLYVTTAGATAALPSVYLADSTHGVDIVLTPENGYGRFGTFTNSPLAFITNNTERMRLDASGNLGLGVTPSANAGGRSLNVGNAGTGAFAAVSLGGAGGDYGGVGYNLGWQTTTGQYKYLQTDASSWIQFAAGGFRFFTAPSGTAGNAITFTQAMTLDASGNLGIGTNSPGAKLDVVGNIRALGGASQTLDIGTLTGASYVQSYGAAGVATPLVFYTGTNERARIDSSGNLGLGVTPSAWGNGASLQGSGWSLSTLLGFDQSAMYTNARQTAYGGFGSNWVYRGTASATGYAQSSGSHVWLTAPSGTAGNAITFTQAMTLDASSRLFVGTASGSAGFNLNSGGAEWFGIGAASTSASYGGFYKGGTTTGVGYLGTDGGGIVGGGSGDNFGIRAENALLFMSGAAERARLDSSGNLGIGTSAPSFTLDISTAAPRIRQTATTGTNSSLIQLVNTGGTAYIGLDSSSGGVSTAYSLNLYHSGAYPIVFSTNATERMRLDSSGNLGIGTSSPIAITGTTVDVAGASGASQRWRNNAGTSSAYLEVAAGVTNFGNAVSTPLAFVTAATERMRLDSSGNLGVGTASPTSTLHVSGSFSRGVPVTKTSNFTLAATENWIIHAGSGAITCTLPAASSCPGREVYFSSQTSSGATNILSSATNIALLTSGGLSSTILDNTGLGFRWVTIVSDGTNWVQVMRGS